MQGVCRAYIVSEAATSTSLLREVSFSFLARNLGTCDPYDRTINRVSLRGIKKSMPRASKLASMPRALM